MPAYTVRCVEVRKKDMLQKVTRADTVFRGLPTRAKTQSPDTMRPPSVKAAATGPLAWVTVLGFTLSVTLFIASFVYGDGMSLLATILLSLLSTIVGIANKWTLKLPQAATSSKKQRGDVVIRYPNGSYLVVRCDEEVARELYFAPEEIEYNIKSAAVYRLISLVGTVMLMLGVICLANARLELQFAWAGAYIGMNIAQWTAAALPQRWHWDLSCYEVKEESFAVGPENENFTEALWRAIMLTKSTRWVKNGKAAPRTDVWDAWLVQALHQTEGVKGKHGKLMKPIYNNQVQAEGVVWYEKEPWDAKDAWDKLKNDVVEAEEHGATEANKHEFKTAEKPVETV